MRTVLGEVLLIVGLVAAVSAIAGEPLGPDEVDAPVTWGTAKSVTRVDGLWIADQPDEAGLRSAKENGITIVINLREEHEIPWDEKPLVEGLGMAYYNVPVAKDGPLSGDQLEKIEGLVEHHHDRHILLHCSSGSRAASWLATHLVGRHGMSEMAALDLARKAGLHKPEALDRVRAYLHARSRTNTQGTD